VPKRPPTAAERALAQAEASDYTEGWPANIPPPTYQHVPRFAVGDERMLDYMEEHGYAVVADVVRRPLQHNLLVARGWQSAPESASQPASAV
jgi:hypothetical protein